MRERNAVQIKIIAKFALIVMYLVEVVALRLRIYRKTANCKISYTHFAFIERSLRTIITTYKRSNERAVGVNIALQKVLGFVRKVFIRAPLIFWA